MKIKKGDNIKVITGKDKGKTGKVIRAFPRTDKIIVEGVNVQKRHRRPTQSNQHGQIVDKTLPIHVSNVMIIDPKTNKPTRIGLEVVAGKKVRIARGSGTQIDK